MSRLWCIWLVLFISTVEGVLAQQEDALQDMAWEVTGSRNDVELWEDLPDQSFYVNQADSLDWMNLGVFSASQVSFIMKYRRRYRIIRSVFELASIPEIDKSLWQSLESRLNFTVSDVPFQHRLKHELWMRYSRVVEQRAGYKESGESGGAAYQGSPAYLLLRYQGEVSSRVSVGLTLEKDSGEPIQWKANKKYYGVEQVGGYIAVKNLLKLDEVILGDFRVRSGQGLVYGSSFFIPSNPEYIIYDKLQLSQLAPYKSASSVLNHYRGVSVSKSYRRLKLMAFVSSRPLSGTVRLNADSMAYLKTERSSDYFRTDTDLDNRFVSRLHQVGVNVALAFKKFDVGANWMYGNYELAMSAIDTMHNFQVASLYAKYRFRKMVAYGEVAADHQGHSAISGGLLMQLEEGVQSVLNVRNYSANFYAPNSNAYGRYSGNENERGIYWGISFNTLPHWNWSIYVDKYKNIAPEVSWEKPLWQNTYGFHVKHEIYNGTKIKLHFRKNMRNSYELAQDDDKIEHPVHKNRWELMTSIQFEPANQLKLSTHWGIHRMSELTGKVLAQDIQYQTGKWMIYYRLAMFDADDYDVRVYLYEKDVLHYFNVPALFNKGNRHALLLKYKANDWLNIWFKAQMIRYENVDEIGSGYEMITGSVRHDVRLQIQLKL